jgi:Dinucleotide-utilizing enzymes involved in molybdopterin and thiamine biosynthesis family 2
MNITGQLIALPVRLIDIDEGILIKRGCVEVVIYGKGAVQITETIFSILRNKVCSKEEVLNNFPDEQRREIESLIDALMARKILLPAHSPLISSIEHEEPIDVFHWHFGLTREIVENKMKSLRFIIVGVNEISFGILGRLKASGVQHIKIIDVPVLRNSFYFDKEQNLNTEKWNWDHPCYQQTWEEESKIEDVDCLIACSDIGGQHLLRKWNEFCVNKNIPFMPIYLQGLIGYIGPFVISRESPCLECLRARYNSHLDNLELSEKSELYGGAIQDISGYHDAMISTLVDFSFFELYKFYNRLPNWNMGKIIEIRLLVPSIDIRRILKAPYCPVCSRKNSVQEISIFKTQERSQCSNLK